MTTTLLAIDMWAPILPTPVILRHAAAHFPKEMLGCSSAPAGFSSAARPSPSSTSSACCR